MGGTCVIEGDFVLFLMEYISLGVHSESSFLHKPFQLAALFFEFMKMVGIPGGRVGVGNGFGFSGGEFIEAGGESGVVVVDQFSWGGVRGGVRYGVRQ